MFFKLRSGTADGARKEIARLARARGATRVRRLFPTSSGVDLRSHFVAEVPGEPEVRDLVAMLKARPEVVFAQREVRRRRLDPE